MTSNDPSDLIDDSPESRNKATEEAYTVEVEEKRSLLSTLILIAVLLLCVLGFTFGMYQVLYA